MKVHAMLDSDKLVHQLSPQGTSRLLAIVQGPTDESTTSPIDDACDALSSGDRARLTLLLSDLETTIGGSTAGPLSFARLCNLDARELHSLAGKTLLEALIDPATTARGLRALADYGGILEASVFPTATRRTGVVVRSIAEAALNAGLSNCSSDQPPNDFARLLDLLSSISILPRELRDRASQLRRSR